MRRSQGHIRQRSPGSWEVRYSLGKDPATGKRRVATATVNGNRRDAEKELRRLLRALDTGEHVDPSRMSAEAWLLTWLESVKANVSPRTHERYSEIVSNYLLPLLGAHRLQKLSAKHIQGAYAALLRGQEGRRPLSARTVRHAHRVLFQALRKAVRWQLISNNPAEAFRDELPKVDRKEMTTISAEQSASLLGQLGGTRLYWPVMLALATGMRRGEILALRWKQVDLDHGVIRVVESLEQTADGLRFKAPKTEKARAITLPRYAIGELKRLKREQAEELLRLGIRQTDQTLAICRFDGAPKQPRSLTHEFTVAVRRLKEFPRIRFHDLRHSHATQLLLAGVHPKVAQERLGHSTIATTLDLYSHVTGTMQEDAAGKLDAAWRAAVNGPA